MAQQKGTVRRTPLSRERVLSAAVVLADESGVESLSMRKLAQELGVVPMALYKHVANKEELLDGMVDVIVGEIDTGASGGDWKSSVRQRVLAARQILLRHPWARRVIESRTNKSPVVLEYMDSMIGMFRAWGFSIDLTFSATIGGEPFKESTTIEYEQPEDCDNSGGGGGLPLTGAAAGSIAGGAGAMLAIGAVLFLMARRRKVKFTA